MPLLFSLSSVTPPVKSSCMMKAFRREPALFSIWALVTVMNLYSKTLMYLISIDRIFIWAEKTDQVDIRMVKLATSALVLGNTFVWVTRWRVRNQP